MRLINVDTLEMHQYFGVKAHRNHDPRARSWHGTRRLAPIQHLRHLFFLDRFLRSPRPDSSRHTNGRATSLLASTARVRTTARPWRRAQSGLVVGRCSCATVKPYRPGHTQQTESRMADQRTAAVLKRLKTPPVTCRKLFKVFKESFCYSWGHRSSPGMSQMKETNF